MKQIIYYLVLASFAVLSCKKDELPQQPGPVEKTLLKDIVIQNLPSPYYHFEYASTGRLNKIGFASGALNYDVHYENERIGELKNNIIVNKDRVQYVYDNTGKVSVLKIVNEAGDVYKRSFLLYNNDGSLKQMEWERKAAAGGFVVYRILSFTYAGDGNLFELVEHRPFIENVQQDVTFTDRFEEYDANTNVDGFMLLHDGSDHLPVLPNVVLQKNNPRKNVRTGDGVNYEVTYTYDYLQNKYPVKKNGVMLITSGTQEGHTFQLRTSYTYYE